MSMPGFTAEVSLGDAKGRYRTVEAGVMATNQVVPQQWQCSQDHGHCTTAGGVSQACVGDVCQECTAWGRYAWINVCTDSRTGRRSVSRGCGICLF